MKSETVFCDRCGKDITGEVIKEVSIEGAKQICLSCGEALSNFFREKDNTKLFFEHRAHTRGEWMVIFGGISFFITVMLLILILAVVFK